MSQQSNPATLREALTAQLEERARQECPKGSHEDHECETCEHCHYYVDTAWIGVEAALATRVNTMNFEEWWHKVGYYEMPKAGEPPEHAAIAKLAWEAALKLNGAVAMNESASQGLQRAASGTEAARIDEYDWTAACLHLISCGTNPLDCPRCREIEAVTLRQPAQAAASPEGEGREAVLREALKSSMVALDDWLNIHASDLCDEQRVEEAHQRINERGTIHYIATVQDRNRAALRQSAAPSGGAVDVEWVNEALKYAGEGRTNTIKPDLLANAINKRFRLAQESKTGAVPETARSPRCQCRSEECGQCELRLGHEGKHLAGYLMWDGAEPKRGPQPLQTGAVTETK